MTELTTEQFLNNQDYVDTLFDYADRQGKIVTSKQEALENFLGDYRGVQANTALALMFKNDIDAIEDQEDKAALGRLYKAVDEDLEDFAGEQSGLETVAEYAGKAILDPINIFGLGVGKAVATAAGRPLLKKFISDAFVKRPITTGVVSGAAVEAPLGAVSAAAVESVKGPDGFGIQEEIETKDLALPAAISGLAGGLFGGIGAKLGKSATKNIQSIIDQAEAATQQGQAAKFTNMKDFIDDQTPSVTGVDKQADSIGVYVSSDTVTPDADNYAQFGRIIDVEGDMAKVEFLPTTYANEKNPTTGLYDDRKVLDISVDKLKPLSVKKKDESLKGYVKENGLFFDKAGIERGKKFLKGEGESDEEITRLFDQTLTEEMFDDVTRFVVDAGLFIKEAQPNSKAAKQIEITLDDPTKRITEKAASLLELSKENPDLLPESIARAMKKNGLTEANIKDIVKAETSIAASKLATQSEIQKLLKGESILGRKLDRALEKLTDTQLAQLKALEKEREIERAIATKFGLSVDIWRSLLVTQPATVLRNVFGSVMRVPGQTLDTFLDEFFIGWESNALGIDAPKIPMRKDALGLTKNLLNPFESVELARIVANNFDEADKKLFRVFDDYFSTDVQAKVGAGPVLKSLHKYSLAANVLSRMQDRAIKSAGFMAELDNQVKQGINRGDIVDDNVTGIIDLIKQNKLNLLNDDMVSKSLSTAYNLTYQNRRAGDDVVFFGAGRLINSIQERVNQSSAIKALIPFPNFIANMIAYNINRLGGGLVKSIAGGTRLLNKKATGGKELAKKQRQRINEIKEELNSLKTMSLQERKKLLKAKGRDHIKKEIDKLSNEFDDLNRQAGERLQDISDIRSGIVQTIEGGALLSMAIAIREEIGGERYNTIKAKGQTIDLSPLFPLTPFLFGAEMYIRLRDGLPFDDSHITEGIQAFTGLQVDRAGPLPKFIQNFARSSQTIFSSEDPEQLKQIGKLVGTTVGHYLKGYLTPFKAPGDLAKTLGSEERRISYERDFQSLETELGDKGIPMGYVLDGAIDEFAKQLFRGTYLEKEVFGEEDTYRYIPPTARKQEQQFLPVAKQFTGMGAAKVIDDVESELLRLDIPSYKFVPASSVPEYKDVYKQELSELSEDIVKPFVNSEYYKSLPYEQKKAELRSFYYGGKGDMDKKQREMVERTGGAAANLREQVSLKIKNEKPLLLQLHNFRKSHKKSEIGRLYRRMKQLDQSIPPLKYIGEETDEKGINEQAKKQSELITLLSSILEDPAKNNSAYITNELRRLGRPVYNKGGYVSQMDELGLAPEGTLVPRASTEVPVTTKDSKRVSQEEVLANLKTLSEIGVDMSPVGTYKAIRDFPENIKDSLNKYRKGQLGKAALQATLSTIDIIPGTPNLSKSISKSTPPSKKISADEVVADDATKMYAKSIEDADRFDNVKDWQKEVKNVMEDRKIDPSVRTPELEVSAKKLVNKEISREEHLRSIDKHKPVRGFDELPREPTDKAVVFALSDPQRADGLFQLPKEVTNKLNVKRSTLKVGDTVLGRLDIPAYTSHDTWIVTLESANVKVLKNGKESRDKIYGKAMHYAPDPKKGYVDFRAGEGLGQKIATGQQTKTPYATIVGTVKDLDPERIRKKASELLNDPEWVQLSFDPRRQTSFYVRKGADGLPVHTPIASADEVIQIGPLVLAKNAVAKTNKDGTPFTNLNRGGAIDRQMNALGL